MLNMARKYDNNDKNDEQSSGPSWSKKFQWMENVGKDLLKESTFSIEESQPRASLYLEDI